MSAVEQGAASRSDADVNVPEFPAAMRGYDRQQVDAFVRDLSIRLTAERRRAEQAERASVQMRTQLASLENQPPPSFEHLGAEAARVLEQAGLSAKMLVEEARNRGQQIVEEAEGQATELIQQAERRAGDLEGEARATLTAAEAERGRVLAEANRTAEDLRGQAEEEARSALQQATDAAERIRQKAMHEQATMQAETDRLRHSRERMLEYLSRIHGDLGELLAEAVQADAEMSAEAEDGPDGDRPDGVRLEVREEAAAAYSTE